MSKPPHKRIAITLPPDWIDAIQSEAKRRGQRTSELLREAVKPLLPYDVQQSLSEPAKPGRRWPEHAEST